MRTPSDISQKKIQAFFSEFSTGTPLGMYPEISVGISPINLLRITPWIYPATYQGILQVILSRISFEIPSGIPAGIPP